MEDKTYKVIKTIRLRPGFSNSARFIGRVKQAELNQGKVIEVSLEQLNQLKKYGWVEIYKETSNVKSDKTKTSRDSSAS